MYKLKIIIGSTRPGRKGAAIANWIFDIAKQHREFETELVDLAEINLPFLDEPHHPILQKYEHQHTKDWSSLINGADAFIFVSPEYNYGYSAPLKNAIDYLFKEWQYKPVAFVSYGGVAAGTRAVQAIKQVVTALKMVPVTEAVNIPFFTKYINEDEIFTGDAAMEATANSMMTELLKWAEALKPLRANNMTKIKKEAA